MGQEPTWQGGGQKARRGNVTGSHAGLIRCRRACGADIKPMGQCSPHLFPQGIAALQARSRSAPLLCQDGMEMTKTSSSCPLPAGEPQNYGQRKGKDGAFPRYGPISSTEPGPARSPGKHLAPMSKPKASFTAGADGCKQLLLPPCQKYPRSPTAQHLRPLPARSRGPPAGSSRDFISANSSQILGGEMPGTWRGV